MLLSECPRCDAKYTLQRATYNYGSPVEWVQIVCTTCGPFKPSMPRLEDDVVSKLELFAHPPYYDD